MGVGAGVGAGGHVVIVLTPSLLHPDEDIGLMVGLTVGIGLMIGGAGVIVCANATGAAADAAIATRAKATAFTWFMSQPSALRNSGLLSVIRAVLPTHLRRRNAPPSPLQH